MRRLVVLAALGLAALGLAALGLAGCASPKPFAEAFTTPEGLPGFVAYCGGYSQMTDCHVVARETCKGNYRVTGEHESTRIVDNKVSAQMNRRLEFVCAS